MADYITKRYIIIVPECYKFTGCVFYQIVSLFPKSSVFIRHIYYVNMSIIWPWSIILQYLIVSIVEYYDFQRFYRILT